MTFFLGWFFFNAAMGRTDSILVNWNGEDTTSMPPGLLSVTGFYTDLKSKQVSDSIWPYFVNVPLWLDGTVSRRHLQVPAGKSIRTVLEGRYDIPVKTLFAKTVFLDTITGVPKSRIAIETRFCVLAEKTGDLETWVSFSYAWKRDQSEAELVPPKTGIGYRDVPVWELNTLKMKKWFFMESGRCASCHQGVRGGVFGINTPQLWRPTEWNPDQNQLSYLQDKGLIVPLPDSVSMAAQGLVLKWSPCSDTAVSLEHRVRSYLASQCYYCHGTKPSKSDWDQVIDYWKTDWLDNYICMASGFPGQPKMIYPGHPDSSRFLFTMALGVETDSNLTDQMPPAYSFINDSVCISILEDWIKSMQPCHVGVGSYKSPNGLTLFKLVDNVLSVSAPEPIKIPEISLMRLSGRPIPLRPLEPGRFGVPADLQSGVYLVRTVSGIVPVVLLR
jgi:hypothetical protein